MTTNTISDQRVCPECGTTAKSKRGYQLHAQAKHPERAEELTEQVEQAFAQVPQDEPAEAVSEAQPRKQMPSAPPVGVAPELSNSKLGFSPADPASDTAVVIHFVEDGMTALGKLWYRGEELALERDSEDFARTCDSDGNSWMDLDERAQFQRYRKVLFRPGPWPYEGWDADYDEEVHQPGDLEALKRAEKRRMRRSGPPGGR